MRTEELAGALPDVAYCGPVEGMTADPFFWIVKIRGGGGAPPPPPYPSEHRQDRGVGEHNGALPAHGGATIMRALPPTPPPPVLIVQTAAPPPPFEPAASSSASSSSSSPPSANAAALLRSEGVASRGGGRDATVPPSSIVGGGPVQEEVEGPPSMFFGVMIHLEIAFPRDYPFKAPRITFAGDWLARVHAILNARPDIITRTSRVALLELETQRRWLLQREWQESSPVAAATGGREHVVAEEGSARRVLTQEAEKAFDEARAAHRAVVRVPGGPRWLIVRTLVGKDISVNGLADGATSLDVKQTILEKEGIPLDSQRLIFSGRQLEDARSLDQYDIGTGEKLHLVLRLRGCTCGSLLGSSADQWSPAFNVPRMLKDLRSDPANSLLRLSAFERDGTPREHDCRYSQLRDVIRACHSDGEVQWLLRAAWPQRDVIWSPEHFRAWPLHFRRCIRYLRGVAVRDGRGRLRPLPYDILNEIAAFL